MLLQSCLFSALAGLSKHETSQQGNYFGIAGMAIALIATITGRTPATSAGLFLRW
ncbi:NAD(P)(+) transhydrogenase (Re/Si-specific) subunit beta [Klebsiella pneumoniae]|uniref:NAD(P)(+) transhydrogenase (Re/Si-specific) subunit beta n=1 Tax=Klebsiella pneumoniae TaxID=573 RepID=A0A939NN02_KLEPN|nr:NAD(P)(+) transhydrogenase (Re/Si-specific) subunit beta [Klebsiella pneumoniae]